MRITGIFAVLFYSVLCSGSLAQEKQAALEKKQEIKTQIYGKLHGSVDQLDDGAENSDTYLSSNSSRLGFKGELDAEPSIGLKAIWQAEAGFSFDEKDNNHFFTTRNTFVGLGSDAGQLIFGRHDTPFKALSQKADMFDDQIGALRNFSKPGGYSWDLRPDNSIRYNSPGYKGFSAAAQYSVPEEKDNSDIISGNVVWSHTLESKDEIALALAYEQHGKWLTGSDTNDDSKIDAASDTEEQGIRAAVCYKLASLGVRMTSLYQKLLDVGGVEGDESDLYGAGVGYTCSKETFKVQYYIRTDSGANAGADIYSIGYDHAFNENIIVYLAYSLTDNEDDSKYTMSGDGHGDVVVPAKGDDPSGFSVGMIYKF